MNPILLTYTLYLTIALPLTVWVARTLHKNGRIFLVDCCKGNEELADSINHLLVVGFYLINFGFVVFFLKVLEPVIDYQDVFEVLGAKIGFVLLVLGGMHFFNIFLFVKMRQRNEEKVHPKPPPLAPQF